MVDLMAILEQTTSKETAHILIGALLGWVPIIIGIVWRLSRHVWLKFDTTEIEGPWYAYHWTMGGGTRQFREHFVKWERTFRGFAVTTYRHDDRTKRRYRGLIREEKGHYIAECKDRWESYVVRLKEIVPIDGNDTMVGLMLGADHDRESFATLMFLSRKPLASADAQRLLAQRAVFAPADLSLRVRPASAARRLSLAPTSPKQQPDVAT